MVKSNTVIDEYEEQIRQKIRSFFTHAKTKRDSGCVYEEHFSIKLIKADNRENFLLLISQFTNIDDYFLVEYVEYATQIKGKKSCAYKATLIRDDSFAIF